MPPSPWRAARGSGMAPEGSREAASSEGEALPGARTRHAGDSHMLGSGKRAVGIPKVRRGQQPGSFSSSSSQENSSLWENHQHPAPPGPEGLVQGGVPRAAGRWERQGELGESLPALPARGSSRNPAGKAAAALGWDGTVPVPAPARAGAPWHSPSSGPVPAPTRIRSPAAIPGWDFGGGSLPQGPVPHALGWVGVGMWLAKPRDGPSQEFPSQ